ncbi:MAG: arsenate reductase ArsC [Bacteroidetes bacterium]|nr:MAG: arsenate reductase ArsC [Bacteroidota bacterium]
MKILILCTGNTCLSQMAEGYLRAFDHNMEVFSAGTEPGEEVNPNAIKVMNEEGISLLNSSPESVNEFLDVDFDYVITVCGGAQESCPTFSGKVKHSLHIGFDDPADAVGTDEFIVSEFRRIRDEIKRDFGDFYKKELTNNK